MTHGTEPFATTVEVFAALHAYVWNLGDAPDTAQVGVALSSAAGEAPWRHSVVYASRFRPSLENTTEPGLPSRGALASGTLLSFDQGRRAAVAMIDAHNAISPTEIWWFAEYLDHDPAAWEDWLAAVDRALAV